MTDRIAKVNSLLEHEIGSIILKDFHFADTLVTLTHVDATSNLIEARVYISVMPEDNADRVIATLNKGVRDVQQKINKKLNMRPVPRIMFLKDEKIQEAARIESLLAQLKKEEK